MNADAELWVDDDPEMAQWRNEQHPDDGPAPFTCDTIDKADWCLRKISEHAASIEEARAFMQRETERVSEWFDRATEADRNRIEWFEGHLHVWAGRLFAELDQSRKTFDLPHGQVKVRESSGEFTIDDRDRALAILSEADRDDLVDTKLAISSSTLSAAVKAGGARIADDGAYEVVDGLTGEWRTLPVRRDGVGRVTFAVVAK